MPRVEIPLIGPDYTNREKPLSAQKAINMWPEINPEARNQVALHNAAGIRVFATLTGVDRGMHDFNNLMYAVNGQTLYSIDNTGANVALGTIPGKDRCQMADDGYQLIIVTGATPYRYTVAGGVEAITDPDVVNPTTIAYINSQFLLDTNTGTWGEFVTTSIEDGFAVDALDFAVAESHPDDITAIIAYRQLAYFFGSHSVEPWSNTGTGNPPWARASSGVRPFGVAGRDAVLTTSEYIYFLDHDRIPRRSNGLDFPSIGTPALGVEFAKYTKIDDVIAFAFIQDGQQFVAFTFPTADTTWCFHEPSGSWFQLEYIKTGAMQGSTAPQVVPSVAIAEDTAGTCTYQAGMMTFDGIGGYFSDTFTPSGNKVTGVIRFNRASFTGGSSEMLWWIGDTYTRISMQLYSNDHASADRRDKMMVFCQSNSGTGISRLFSDVDVCDGADHIVFYSFDGDIGSATFYIDGVDADDALHASREAPTTGTLEAGSVTAHIGAYLGSLYYGGDAGFAGYKDAYLTNPTDFMTGSNPLAIDETGWTEWGSQPAYWQYEGNLGVVNLGDEGLMTANATITGPAISGVGTGCEATGTYSYTVADFDNAPDSQTWEIISGSAAIVGSTTGTTVDVLTDSTAGTVDFQLKVTVTDSITSSVASSILAGSHTHASVPLYDPQSMTYDGSSGYYSKTITTAGNLVFGCMRFKRASFSGGGIERLMNVAGAGGYGRIGMFIAANDFSTAAYQDKLAVTTADSTGTNICVLTSINDVADNAEHTVTYAFDGDNGTAIFYIDGVDADDTGSAVRVAPTTGTLAAGAATVISYGALTAPSQYYGGEGSYTGYDDQYLTNPTDFYHPTNGLQELDTSGWTEFGSQPSTFSPNGKLDTNNLGSDGALTKTGTITGPA